MAVYRRLWKILHAVETAGDALCIAVIVALLYVLEVLKACALCGSVYWKLSKLW